MQVHTISELGQQCCNRTHDVVCKRMPRPEIFSKQLVGRFSCLQKSGEVTQVCINQI